MIVLIDNGHGRDTPGKRSPDAVRGLNQSPLYLREYEWAREMADRVCDGLHAKGLLACRLVKEDEDVSLAERVAREHAYCNQFGKRNVILVSIHINASGDGSRWMTAKGWSAYTSPGMTAADELARHLYLQADRCFPDRSIRRFGTKVYDWDWEENLYILKNTICPAVLTENFFQDNRSDVEYLKSEAGKAAIADCHVEGIYNYVQSL